MKIAPRLGLRHNLGSHAEWCEQLDTAVPQLISLSHANPHIRIDHVGTLHRFIDILSHANVRAGKSRCFLALLQIHGW